MSVFRGNVNDEKCSCGEPSRQFPELRKQLWRVKFWSDGGYVGTARGIWAGIVRNCVKKLGITEWTKAISKWIYSNEFLLNFS